MRTETEEPARITADAVNIPEATGRLKICENIFAITITAIAPSFTIHFPTESVKIHLRIAPRKAEAAQGRFTAPTKDISANDAAPAIVPPENRNPPANARTDPAAVDIFFLSFTFFNTNISIQSVMFQLYHELNVIFCRIPYSE